MLYLLFSLGVLLIIINAKKVVEIGRMGNQEGEDKEEVLKEENFKKENPREEKLLYSMDQEEVQLLKKEVQAVLDELKEEKRKLYYLKIKDSMVKKEKPQDKSDKPQVQPEQEKIEREESGQDKNKEIKELYSQVHSLREKGKDNGEIARKLNIGKGEVEFILSIKR